MASRTRQADKKKRLVETKTSAGFTQITETAARAGAATLIDTAKAVLDGEVGCGFVMCRPPTHHATGNHARARGASPKLQPFGFCHVK